MRKQPEPRARNAEHGKFTIGLDLGDRWAQVCILDKDGEIIHEDRVKLTQQALVARFDGLQCARVALEAGTHSLWVSALLTELTHDVIMANVRELAAITGSTKKSDKNMLSSWRDMLALIYLFFVQFDTVPLNRGAT
ncbi:MAG: hypothetical protein JO033_09645 [Acidobacteriaceae bacterium]|nr:hypothetical protein [Acidobacteriaceae bacterium]MBV9501815.1 hypothetical protein [Acidobacteriaceae bacterium]